AKASVLSASGQIRARPSITKDSNCCAGATPSHTSAGFLFPIPPISHHHSRTLPERNLRFPTSQICGPIGGYRRLKIIGTGDAVDDAESSSRVHWRGPLLTEVDVWKPECVTATNEPEKRNRQGAGGKS